MSGREIARLDEHDGGGYGRWVQRDDGSMWVLDEYGVQWPVAAFTHVELDADAQAALGAIGYGHLFDDDLDGVADRMGADTAMPLQGVPKKCPHGQIYGPSGHEKSPPPVPTGGGPWWSSREGTRNGPTSCIILPTCDDVSK
ncbi:hypothetical protein [Nocardia mangyaensis]|uniref:hypothetical protein n=1 Tax=Nocardia mangyaensis TaxID=2213200 RepID=UPI002676A54B|nr:hypothetical protein [Nocardia mangyaensis]MDO3645693.1 hypothetical protein [Nocardia mangyaensis]